MYYHGFDKKFPSGSKYWTLYDDQLIGMLFSKIVNRTVSVETDGVSREAWWTRWSRTSSISVSTSTRISTTADRLGQTCFEQPGSPGFFRFRTGNN
jgi:hypothetical protein